VLEGTIGLSASVLSLCEFITDLTISVNSLKAHARLPPRPAADCGFLSEKTWEKLREYCLRPLPFTPRVCYNGYPV